MQTPLITNDAIVFGLLISVLALVFTTAASNRPIFKKFYSVVPPLLLCYFIPALLYWPLGLISGEGSKLYSVATRYFLPASLLLLCVSIDFKAILKLGPKALIMFLTGTLGVVIGGPLALFIVYNLMPGSIAVPPDQIWRGLSAIAGSWIGGGGNQAAMREIYNVSDELFGVMVVVDVIVANIWMAFLLYGAGITQRINRFFRADDSAIEEVKRKVSEFRSGIERIPSSKDLFVLMAVAFGGVALSHWGAEVFIKPIKAYNDSTIGEFSYQQVTTVRGEAVLMDISATQYDSLHKIQVANGGFVFAAADSTIAVKETILKAGTHKGVLVESGLDTFMAEFFWIIVLATTIGLLLSFYRPARELEGVGASKWGSIFIYLMVATIGMKMDLGKMFQAGYLPFFLIGIIWMLVHATLLIVVARLIKAPFFFMAVGSQANIGGAASAPVVASAFSPSLAPVGVLLAVLGYALGTYGAIIAAGIMKWIVS